MHITVKCAAKIFSSFIPALVTDTGSVITDSTSVTVTPCRGTTRNELSDIMFFTRTSIIPLWAWTLSYLIVVNGRTYSPSIINESPYIKGLQYLPEYIPHMDISLLYIPFDNVRSPLTNVSTALVTDPVPPTLELTSPVIDATPHYLFFLGGLLIDSASVSIAGTTAIITLSQEVLDTLTTPIAAAPAMTISDIGSLLSHPGTFVVRVDPVTVEHLPLGKTTHPLAGSPPAKQLPAIDDVGHILSYKPQASGIVRFRYCHIQPTKWVKIMRDYSLILTEDNNVVINQNSD